MSRKRTYPTPAQAVALMRPRIADLPRAYDLKLVKQVCDRMAAGEPLNVVLADADMPGWSQWFRWVAEHDEAAALYAEARERLADAMAFFIHGLAYDVAQPHGLDPQRARAAMHGADWIASRLAPRRYADRSSVQAGVQVIINTNLALDGDASGERPEDTVISGTYTIVEPPLEGRDSLEGRGARPPNGSHPPSRQRRGSRSVSGGRSKKITKKSRTSTPKPEPDT